MNAKYIAAVDKAAQTIYIVNKILSPDAGPELSGQPLVYRLPCPTIGDSLMLVGRLKYDAAFILKYECNDRPVDTLHECHSKLDMLERTLNVLYRNFYPNERVKEAIETATTFEALSNAFQICNSFQANYDSTSENTNVMKHVSHIAPSLYVENGFAETSKGLDLEISSIDFHHPQYEEFEKGLCSIDSVTLISNLLKKDDSSRLNTSLFQERYPIYKSLRTMYRKSKNVLLVRMLEDAQPLDHEVYFRGENIAVKLLDESKFGNVYVGEYTEMFTTYTVLFDFDWR